MTWTEPDDVEVASIVRGAKVVAVVGMKDERSRSAPAFSIPAQMKAHGIRVLPVNPTIESTLGEPSLARLADLRERPDIVQIFRRPELVEALADEILALPAAVRPKVAWMQSGIVSLPAAEKLEASGIRVVMDRCFGVDLARLGR